MSDRGLGRSTGEWGTAGVGRSRRGRGRELVRGRAVLAAAAAVLIGGLGALGLGVLPAAATAPAAAHPSPPSSGSVARPAAAPLSYTSGPPAAVASLSDVPLAGAAPLAGISPAAVAPLVDLPPVAAGSHAAPASTADDPGVDDFAFASFDADYTLARDASGASTLHVVETLVAEFPETDQNRGIRRAIPTDYDRHPTALDIVSVVDGDGRERSYESDTDDGFEVVTIADDDYVHGTQTYVITYRQTDVTKTFDDTGVDEFYRDINGTAWRQPFGTVSASLSVSEELASSLTGASACYRGPEGSTEPCTVVAGPDGGFVVSETGLAPGENVTIAVAFRAGTFAAWDPSFAASGLLPALLVGLGALLLSLAVAVWARLTISADAPGRPTIIAEFEPPREPELALVGAVLHRKAAVLSAVLVSFAVRRIAQIVDSGGSYALRYMGAEVGRKGSPAGPGSAGLAPVEASIARAFFGATFTPGETASLSSPGEGTTKKVGAVLTGLDAKVVEAGYRRAMPRGPVVAVAVLSFVAVVALGATGFGLIGQQRAGWIAALSLVAAVAAIAVLPLVIRRPLTPAGAELRDHVKGVRMYLRVAEEERIRLLQSVDGAERGEESGERVVRVYERLLPVAVLLGVDRSWSRVLGAAYERSGSEPDWFAGTDGFTVAAFASGIHSMSASTATFAGGSSGSSSSSGGSAGGGFSGGGSGGGGGGGV